MKRCKGINSTPFGQNLQYLNSLHILTNTVEYKARLLSLRDTISVERPALIYTYNYKMYKNKYIYQI